MPAHYGDYLYGGRWYHTAETATAAEVEAYAMTQAGDRAEAIAYLRALDPDKTRDEMRASGRPLRYASICVWPWAVRRAINNLLGDLIREVEEDE